MRHAAEPEWSPLLAKTLPHAESVQPSLLPSKAFRRWETALRTRDQIPVEQ